MLSVVSRAALGGGGRSLAQASTAAAKFTPEQQRTIKSQARREAEGYVQEYEPWPYQKIGYQPFHQATDWTHKRLDENSKIIVVDGNIGSGKSTAAKELADKLGMMYMPEFDTTNILIKGSGVDLRDHYNKLPPKMRMHTIKSLNENPKKYNTSLFQFHMFFGRFEQYLNALAHMFNTGQGVVMDRSVFSDFVFTNAGYEAGYINANFHRFYFYMRLIAFTHLQKFYPHCVVYLDTPADQCLQAIQKRGNSYEQKSPFLNKKYLGVIDDSYKDLLKELKQHSKMLIYDWTKDRNVDVIVDDLEKIDFDFFDPHANTVLEKWQTTVLSPADRFKWNYWRRYFTEKFEATSWPTEIVDAMQDVNELVTSYDDYVQYDSVHAKFVYKDGIVDNMHPSKLRENWWAQLVMDSSSKPLYPWYDHYFKDAWYGQECRLFVGAWDRNGEECYDPHFCAHFYGEHHDHH